MIWSTCLFTSCQLISHNQFVSVPVTFNVKNSTRRMSKHSVRRLSRKYGSSQKLEHDPAVLARRQKQIDYGKNTVGYDRYRSSVPMKERDKNHPQTPPMHLQYSRRAWDGLIKIWRKRLHFWDPPSEGGGDPALLEDDESSVDDLSLDTSSVMSTPQQDSKRRKGLDRDEVDDVKDSGNDGGDDDNDEDDDDDDEEEGCKPLPIEDWILSDNEVDEEDKKMDSGDDD